MNPKSLLSQDRRELQDLRIERLFLADDFAQRRRLHFALEQAHEDAKHMTAKSGR